MAITTGNRYSDNAIQWYLDEQVGPTGRTAKLVVNPAKLVAETTTDDDGNEVERLVEESWYSRTRELTLYRAGKQVVVFHNLQSYQAEQVAEAWVDQGE